MKNQKLCEELSKHDVPEDLWPGILCRLPVKSLLRFRSVSKSWLALIDDPEFPRLHLKNFRNNGNETHLLVLQNSSRERVLRCSETFENHSGTIHTLGRWDIVCSVDGLILLTSDEVWGGPKSSELVWNPSIRKFRELPSSPELDGPPHTKLMHVAIGLGYDTLAKDYKIVKLVLVNGTNLSSLTLHSVAIFILGANSWKIIKSQGMGEFNICRVIKSSCKGLYFRGCLYWIASAKDLVLFELSSEVLSSISMPSVSHPDPFRHRWEKLALVDGGCTVAALYSSPEESCMWVLDTESMDWERRYTFQLQCDKVLHLKNNGDILVRRVQTENIAAENAEEQNFVRWDQVGSYSPKTDEYKILEELRSPFYIICYVYGFNESLILRN